MASFDLRRIQDDLKTQRWFAGKGREIRSLDALRLLRFPGIDDAALVALQVAYASGAPEQYLVALSLRPGDAPFNPALDERFAAAALKLIRQNASVDSGASTLRGERVDDEEKTLDRLEENPPARRLGAEQSNTSIVFGNAVMLKLLRKLQGGDNPEYEMGRFLAERGYRGAPALLGALHLEGPSGGNVAVAHRFVPKAEEGWQYFLGVFGKASALDEEVRREISELGGALAELHLALAGEPRNAAFAPEPMTAADLQKWSSVLAAELEETLSAARRQFPEVDRRSQELSERVRLVGGLPPAGKKIRVHGDLHLGQVLKAQGKWYLFDFEGEPSRPFSERKEKTSPLKDVAGLLRSFAYATATAERQGGPKAKQLGEARRALLDGYLEKVRGKGLLPEAESGWKALLAAFELEKLLYEVRYELHHRPDWIHIPMDALLNSEPEI